MVAFFRARWHLCPLNVGLAIVLVAPAAPAAALTWDSSGTHPASPTDGGGFWDTTSATHWSNGTTDSVWIPDSAAVFGNANGAAGTVTIDDASQNVRVDDSMIFNAAGSGNYTIDSNNSSQITFVSSTGFSPTIAIASGTSATINVPIGGGGGLTLTGGGTLTFGAHNIYTSDTFLNGGTMVLAAGADGTSLTGTFTFGATSGSSVVSSLDLTNATLNVGGATGIGLLVQTNSATANNITIGPGKKLVINALAIIGIDDVTPTVVNFTGGGTLALQSSLVLETPTLTINSGASGLAAVNIVSTQNIQVDGGCALTINAPVTGGSFVKVGQGTLTLAGTNTYTGSTLLDGGTVKFTANNTLSGQVTFGSTAGSANTSTLDLNSANLTFAGFTARTGSSTANVVTIGAGKTLTVNGTSTFGATNLAATTNTVFNGGGSFVSSGTAFVIAPSVSGTTSNSVSVDMSGLNSFSYSTNSSGQFALGGGLSSGSGNHANGSFTLPAAGASPTATITAGTVTFGGGATNTGSAVLHLGAGPNTINANSVRIGTDHSSATIDFGANATGSLKIRGFNGGPTDRATISIANNSLTGSATTTTSTVNLSGHPVDILADTLLIGQSTSSVSVSGSLTFDAGTIDANVVEMGFNTAGSASGSITLGAPASGPGGTLNVGSFGIIMTYSTSNAMTASLVINGGTVSSLGGVVEGPNTVGLSTVVLSGGTLDVNGRFIGMGGTGHIDNLSFQSGTLKNVANINGGETGLIKTTTGTLTLPTANGYGGGTTVNGGTIIVGDPGALGSGGLTIVGGAKAVLQAGLPGPVQLPSLVMSGASVSFENTTDYDLGSDGLTDPNYDFRSAGFAEHEGPMAGSAADTGIEVNNLQAVPEPGGLALFAIAILQLIAWGEYWRRT